MTAPKSRLAYRLSRLEAHPADRTAVPEALVRVYWARPTFWRALCRWSHAGDPDRVRRSLGQILAAVGLGLMPRQGEQPRA